MEVPSSGFLYDELADSWKLDGLSGAQGPKDSVNQRIHLLLRLGFGLPGFPRQAPSQIFAFHRSQSTNSTCRGWPDSCCKHMKMRII